MNANTIVNSLLETELPDSSFYEPGISGVRYNDRAYTFYPYLGKIPHEKGGLQGVIKTKAGPVHGRFFSVGQFFYFEPSV